MNSTSVCDHILQHDLRMILCFNGSKNIWLFKEVKLSKCQMLHCIIDLEIMQIFKSYNLQNLKSTKKLIVLSDFHLWFQILSYLVHGILISWRSGDVLKRQRKSESSQGISNAVLMRVLLRTALNNKWDADESKAELTWTCQTHFTHDMSTN